MFNNFKWQHQNRLHLLTRALTLVLVFGLLIPLSSCGKIEQQSIENKKVITNQLVADADINALVDHLLLARKSGSTTRALAIHFPGLERVKAYTIQMALLAKMESLGEKVVGWKMGGTKISKLGEELDPIFGFMLASNEVKSGSTINSEQFATGTPMVEAEVCFSLKRDLPGPEVTREELTSAIAGVGGASELISVRVRDVDGGTKAGVHLGIADGLSHGGFILPAQQFPLDQVDFSAEKGQVAINGAVIAKGEANKMMEGAPLDAVLALANELPKYGRYLRAGDVVIIGSMLESPPAKAGDHAEIIFSSFGTLNFTLE